jgi:hypothetical protein
MAEIPRPWESYERVQRALSVTSCVTTAAALEDALNVVHRADFRPEAFREDDLLHVVETAARRERHRMNLIRKATAPHVGAAPDEPDIEIQRSGTGNLEDQVHARQELVRIEHLIGKPDWELVTGIAAGASYEALAVEQATTSSALRSRVCRLLKAIA